MSHVIKTGQNKEERMMACINILPAPTSAIFIGKMHKSKAEIDKKKEDVASLFGVIQLL